MKSYTLQMASSYVLFPPPVPALNLISGRGNTNLQECNNVDVEIPFLFFPIFFVATWVSVLGVLARVGGWSRLSATYPCDDPRVTSWKGLRWAKIGPVSYKQCLSIAVAPEGLYLKTGLPFLFRAFHPPLRIPWSAIRS